MRPCLEKRKERRKDEGRDVKGRGNRGAESGEGKEKGEQVRNLEEKPDHAWSHQP